MRARHRFTRYDSDICSFPCGGVTVIDPPNSMAGGSERSIRNQARHRRRRFSPVHRSRRSHNSRYRGPTQSTRTRCRQNRQLVRSQVAEIFWKGVGCTRRLEKESNRAAVRSQPRCLGETVRRPLLRPGYNRKSSTRLHHDQFASGFETGIRRRTRCAPHMVQR